MWLWWVWINIRTWINWVWDGNLWSIFWLHQSLLLSVSIPICDSSYIYIYTEICGRRSNYLNWFRKLWQLHMPCAGSHAGNSIQTKDTFVVNGWDNNNVTPRVYVLFLESYRPVEITGSSAFGGKIHFLDDIYKNTYIGLVLLPYTLLTWCMVIIHIENYLLADSFSFQFISNPAPPPNI